MLINVILFAFLLCGIGVLLFFLVCLVKQHKDSINTESIELFPKEAMYVKNAYEGEKFNISIADRKESERWATIQRGSVRIACGVYFTSDEYAEYRERILKTELP